jgi:hypothetical protein
MCLGVLFPGKAGSGTWQNREDYYICHIIGLHLLFRLLSYSSSLNQTKLLMDQLLTFSSEKVKFQDFFTSKYANVSFDPQTRIALCTVTTPYVPMAEFQLLFKKISELVKQEKITKFIFDKRQMTTFHQPSMEWYHLIWKQEMYAQGLRAHRKLLPNDPLFEQSVQTGRRKIARENPDFDFEKFNIVYCKTIEEAIER